LLTLVPVHIVAVMQSAYSMICVFTCPCSRR